MTVEPIESPPPAGDEPAATAARASDEGDAPESFTRYLAKRLIGDKRFSVGVPEEAAALAEQSDVALAYVDLGLALAFILDRDKSDGQTFSLSQAQIADIGRACVKYTGTMNGAKMPVGITLYEVSERPPNEEDQRRLRALQKTMPGLAHVSITCFYIDTRSRTLWASAPLDGLLGRVGHRGWLRALVEQPRKADEEIFVPDAALPQRERLPVATVTLLALLLGAFVVEQIAKIGDKGASGPLGVDVGTLLALGGMNKSAVLMKGEWYRLLSAAFLHGDAFHLLLNGLALGLSGIFLESLLGRSWFLVLFFAGALGGSLMGLVFNPDNLVSIGASGAVMGLLAAALVVATRFPPGPARTQIQIPMLQFLLPSLLPLATHRQGGQIDFAAHFGGAIIGGAAGYALMRLWPRDAEQPRLQGATRGLAAASIVTAALCLLAAGRAYPAYAAEVAFDSANLLVDDEQIPKDIAVAKREVERWGRDHPRDPRVHFIRALHLLDEGDPDAAVREMRAALAEREILDRAFSSKLLEMDIRVALSEVLSQRGRSDEAKREAAVVCKADGFSAQQDVRALGLCE